MRSVLRGAEGRFGEGCWLCAEARRLVRMHTMFKRDRRMKEQKEEHGRRKCEGGNPGLVGAWVGGAGRCGRPRRARRGSI